MTALTNIKAITPTAGHRAAAREAGTDADMILEQLKAQLLDVVLMTKQIIKHLPEGDANLAPLNALLDKLS